MHASSPQAPHALSCFLSAALFRGVCAFSSFACSHPPHSRYDINAHDSPASLRLRVSFPHPTHHHFWSLFAGAEHLHSPAALSSCSACAFAVWYVPTKRRSATRTPPLAAALRAVRFARSDTCPPPLPPLPLRGLVSGMYVSLVARPPRTSAAATTVGWITPAVSVRRRPSCQRHSIPSSAMMAASNADASRIARL